MSRFAIACILGVVLSVVAGPALAEEAASEEPVVSKLVSKKDAWLADKLDRQAAVLPAAKKNLARSLRRRVGRKPAPMVNIFNTWTHETVAVEYQPRAHRGGVRRARKRISAAKAMSVEESSWHLRCHFTNEPTEMDARLFHVLIEAAHHFKVPRVEIISGFRAPKYNLTLRKKGREVARRSHHTLGEAVDFRLPGVSVPKLRRWARKLLLGGVGYYPNSRFVHVDVGKVRTWRGD